MKPTVIAKLPNAGLANCLFVWARAAVYANQHSLRLETIGWNRIHIGPILRGERVKRYYRGYFKDQTSLARETVLKQKLKIKKTLFNPEAAQLPTDIDYLVFDELPHWSDYFKHLKPHRALVKKLFFNNINASLLEQSGLQEKPEVSIHVRMGDFKVLAENQDFAKVGLVRTPLTYFEKVWDKLQSKGYQKAMIFSDGRTAELSDLLKLKGMTRAPLQKDLLDLIQMSKSEVIITSASSSFSLWASFLSDATIIMHPDHIHELIRLEDNLIEISASEIQKQMNQKDGQ
jgi:hypothetical protein